MNEAEMKHHLAELAQEAFPDTSDAWPSLKERLQISNRIAHPRGFAMKKQINPTKTFLPAMRVVAILGFALLLAGVVFLTTPQGRAWAQSIMHFFQRGESNIMPDVTVTPVKWVEQTPGVAVATVTPQPPQPTPPGPAFEATCGAYQVAHCTIEDIRGMVSFPVFALAEPPDGMHFAGATGGPDQVHLYYDTPDQTGFLLIVQQPYTGTGNQLAMEVGADAEIQNVLVGPVQAEYVKGSYDGSSNPPVWNSNLDLQQLRWVNQSMLFTLYHNGTQPRLSRDDLVTLAASLTDGPVGVNGQPAMLANITPSPEPTFDPHTLYPLTLAEAEAQAGFVLLSPPRLPETYSFIGAAYDEQTKVVEISYLYHHPTYPEAQGGLLVREQLASAGDDCDLCGFTRRDGNLAPEAPLNMILKMIPKDAIIEMVQIGDLTGQYVEGTEYNGGQWDPTPFRKRLRSQINGLAIELWSDSFEMTKADLIAIVESLK